MNLIQVQEQLKGLPTQAIMAYANGHNPEVPPYVALAELNRRKQMEQGGAAMQGGKKPTIKDQVEQSIGLMGLQQAKQQQAMQQVAQAAPQTPIPEQAPEGPVQGEPQGFAEGGSIDENPDDMYFMSKDEGGGDGISEWARKIKEAREAKAAEEAGIPKLVRVPGRGFQMQGGDTPISPTAPVAPAMNQTPEETARLLRQNTALQQGIAANMPDTSNPFANKAQTLPPTEAAKKIAQGTPVSAAAKPEQQGIAAVMENTAAKLQPKIVDAITEGLKEGKSVRQSFDEYKELNPVSPYQEMLVKQLMEDRKEQLARRQAPKNWYENEGLMAQLRGFAQADPRRALGAGSAASAAYAQQLQQQRAAEDAAHRQGLAGLANYDTERNAKATDYATGRANAASTTRNSAITAGTQMTDAAMRQAQADANHRAQMAQVAVGQESNRIARQAALDAKQQGLDQQAAATIGKLAADYYDKTFKGSEYLYNTPEKQRALQDEALAWARRAYAPKSGSAAPKTLDWNQISASR